MYEEYLRDTSADPKLMAEHGEGHKPIEVSKIIRKKISQDGPEYIVYSQTEYRLDKALNVKHWFLPNIGLYPIPKGRYEIEHLDFGKQRRVFKELMGIDTGYSIPFSKENMDKIHDLGLNKEGKTQYIVEVPNGLKFSVATYEDLRNGDFDELCAYLDQWNVGYG